MRAPQPQTPNSWPADDRQDAGAYGHVGERTFLHTIALALRRNQGFSLRDRIFIIHTCLFILVGVAILIRSALGGLTLLAVVVGGGFLAFGVYRLRWLWRYGQRIGRRV